MAAIKMGLEKLAGCESTLVAALYDQSEIVRRTVALSLVALDTVRGLAAVVAGSRHGHAVRTVAAWRLRVLMTPAGLGHVQPLRVIIAGDSGIMAAVALSDLGQYVPVDIGNIDTGLAESNAGVLSISLRATAA